MYKNIDIALSSHRQKSRYGIVVFIFEDKDPATYFKNHLITRWRVKRVGGTSQALVGCFRKLSQGVRNWDSFIEMNALDVIQQLDCVPWKIEAPLHTRPNLLLM